MIIVATFVPGCVVETDIKGQSVKVHLVASDNDHSKGLLWSNLLGHANGHAQMRLRFWDGKRKSKFYTVHHRGTTTIFFLSSFEAKEVKIWDLSVECNTLLVNYAPCDVLLEPLGDTPALGNWKLPEKPAATYLDRGCSFVPLMLDKDAKISFKLVTRDLKNARRMKGDMDDGQKILWEPLGAFSNRDLDSPFNLPPKLFSMDLFLVSSHWGEKGTDDADIVAINVPTSKDTLTVPTSRHTLTKTFQPDMNTYVQTIKPSTWKCLTNLIEQKQKLPSTPAKIKKEHSKKGKAQSEGAKRQEHHSLTNGIEAKIDEADDDEVDDKGALAEKVILVLKDVYKLQQLMHILDTEELEVFIQPLQRLHNQMERRLKPFLAKHKLKRSNWPELDPDPFENEPVPRNTAALDVYTALK